MYLSSDTHPYNAPEYLRTLPSIRERSTSVFELAKTAQLQYFDYHAERESAVIDFCISLIERDYGTDYDSIPPHGRWRHFDVGGHKRIDSLLSGWKAKEPTLQPTEACKRLLDLFLVSVLLDAGAGNAWQYNEAATGEAYSRSEGLAIASLDMFSAGLFSGTDVPYRVDARGLERLTLERFTHAMQADSIVNPLAGLEGRFSLLTKLADALRARPDFFGSECRAGNMLDYLESQKSEESDARRPSVHIASLWHVLMDGLASIWPQSRTQLNGISLGDVWPCPALHAFLSSSGREIGPGDDLVPFHKLTQWLCYSLVEVLEKMMSWKVHGTGDLTGLPEYRNGGLLVDFGVLSLKRDQAYPAPETIAKFPASHPAIVEWRAMTVVELDRIAEGIRRRLGEGARKLSLPQILESATWKGGREIAKRRRADGGPPIEIESDGTVF